MFDTGITAVVAHDDEVKGITGARVLCRMGRSVRVGRQKVFAIEVFCQAALNLINEERCKSQNRHQGCRHAGQDNRQYAAALDRLGSRIGLCKGWLAEHRGLRACRARLASASSLRA